MTDFNDDIYREPEREYDPEPACRPPSFSGPAPSPALWLTDEELANPPDPDSIINLEGSRMTQREAYSIIRAYRQQRNSDPAAHVVSWTATTASGSAAPLPPPRRQAAPEQKLTLRDILRRKAEQLVSDGKTTKSVDQLVHGWLGLDYEPVPQQQQQHETAAAGNGNHSISPEAQALLERISDRNPFGFPPADFRALFEGRWEAVAKKRFSSPKNAQLDFRRLLVQVGLKDPAVDREHLAELYTRSGWTAEKDARADLQNTHAWLCRQKGITPASFFSTIVPAPAPRPTAPPRDALGDRPQPPPAAAVTAKSGRKLGKDNIAGSREALRAFFQQKASGPEGLVMSEKDIAKETGMSPKTAQRGVRFLLEKNKIRRQPSSVKTGTQHREIYQYWLIQPESEKETC